MLPGTIRIHSRSHVVAMAAIVTIACVLGAVFTTSHVLADAPEEVLRKAFWLSVGLPLVLAPACILALGETIRRLEIAHEELSRLAWVDDLTGLLNRRGFAAQADRLLALARRRDLEVYVISLDLDGLKGVNDTRGHDAGDYVLVECARALACGVRKFDAVGRMGGDEFVVLLYDMSSADAIVIAERLRSRIRDLDLGITASLGLARVVGNDDLSVALKNADEALYRAKQAGRDEVVVFPGSQRRLGSPGDRPSRAA